MDVGLLLIRVVIGLLFAAHGTQKLFGWFGGEGLGGMTGFFEGLGYRPGRAFALLAGLTELAAGLLFALGLLTPLAAAGIIGVMLNAVWRVHRTSGLWAPKGGYEYPLVLAVTAAGVAFTGPGDYSLDRAFGWSLGGNEWGIVAIVLGVIVALVVLALSRGPLTTGQRAGA